MKNICIVICNYNRKFDLLNALDSINENAINIADILIVDNASTDGTVDYVKEYYPNTECLRLDSNRGGSGGFSYGMEQAYRRGYEYLVLLDSDAAIENDTLETMYKYLDSNDTVGIVGPAICYMDSPSRIQELGGNFSLDFADFIPLYRGANYPFSGDNVIKCDYVPACCMMLKRRVIDDIGFFDSGFFLYWDDISWCRKAAKCHWSTHCLTTIRALHKGGGSRARNTLPRYYYWKNKLRFLKEINIKSPEIIEAIFNYYFIASINSRNQSVSVMEKAIIDISDANSNEYFPESIVEERNNSYPFSANDSVTLIFSENIEEIPLHTRNSMIINFLDKCREMNDMTFYVKNDWGVNHYYDYPNNIFPIKDDGREVNYELYVGMHCMHEYKYGCTDLFWNYIPKTLSSDFLINIINDWNKIQYNIIKYLG